MLDKVLQELPQWTHGGIVFAPKPRSYRYTLNKKSKTSCNEIRTFQQSVRQRIGCT